MADRAKRPMLQDVEKRIFVDLVREQDRRMAENRRRGEDMLSGVTYANALVAERHHITGVDLDRIVRRGIDRDWLDLVDGAPATLPMNGEVHDGQPE